MTISYGDYTITKGKFCYAPMRPGMLRRSGPARRIARTKLKQEIAELQSYIDFLKKCDRLLDKEKVI